LGAGAPIFDAAFGISRYTLTASQPFDSGVILFKA